MYIVFHLTCGRLGVKVTVYRIPRKHPDGGVLLSKVGVKPEYSTWDVNTFVCIYVCMYVSDTRPV